jgi:hypothetical protein
MKRTVVLIAMLFTAPSLFAQIMESFAGVRFQFDDPGARALALGGASCALQDDTNALINAAAIAGAQRSSITIEGRDREHTSTFNVPVQGLAGTAPVTTSRRGVSSIAATFARGRGSYSLFADRPIDQQSDTRDIAAFPSQSEPIPQVALIGERIVPIEECHGRWTNVEMHPMRLWSASLRESRFGGAAAWSLGSWSVGGSLRYDKLDGNASLGDVGGPATLAQGATHDHDLSWSAGFQWQVAPSARVGASYASGAQFRTTERLADDSLRSLEFHTPSKARAGIAITPTPSLTLTADVVRVMYGDMTNAVLEGEGAGMPDVTELHAGAELRLGSVALRAGWWRDPAHELRVTGASLASPSLELYQLARETESHVTAGIGVGGPGLRVNAAYDHGSRSRQASIALTSTF